jgi:hypothetical protein
MGAAQDLPDGLSRDEDRTPPPTDTRGFIVTTATDDLPDLEALREEQRTLQARLGRLRRRLSLQSALEYAADAAAVLAATAAVLVLLDWWFRFGLAPRRILLALAAIGLLAFLAARGLRRWRETRLDDLSLAMTLDRFRPGTGQRVADVLQLPGLLDDGPAAASPSMVRLAVRRASEALGASDWHLLWNRGRTLKRLGALLGCLAVPAAFAAVAPDAARLSVARWLLGSNERWPQETYLTVTGLGDRDRLIAPRDEPFAVEVRSDLPQADERDGGWSVPGRGEPLLLRRRPESPAEPAEVTVRERVEGTSGRRDGVMTLAGPGKFRFEFPPALASSAFELRGGDDWLGPIRIERLDRPSLAGIRLRVKEPGASYPDFREIEDTRQHLAFLPDTEIELTLTGSEPLASLRLDAQPGEVPAPARVDERTFAARWTLCEATTLEIHLASESSGLASKPAFLSLGLMRDREPRVTLRAVGVGARVTPVATIPLSLAATDDLGLAAFRLQADRIAPTKDGADEKPPEPRRQTVAIPLPGTEVRPALDHQARHDVELQVDSPEVGSTLKFVAEAEDRCARGAQIGRSGVLQFQVVTADELFYDILMRQRAERAKFLAALEAVEKQGPALEGAPARDDYLGAMRTLHTNSRQLGQIAGRISDTLQEMKLNQVGSPKSHRLLQEGVIDPIRALEAGQMGELRGVLQALTGGAPKAGADAESARKLHGEVVTSMRNILEKMSQWESFVDVVNQVAEVIKMQQKILQDTEKARESRTQEVFDAKQ